MHCRRILLAVTVQTGHSEPFNTHDPASWNASHADRTAIEELEHEVFEPNTYREASPHLMRVLRWVDTSLSTARDARIASIQIAAALKLPSVEGRAETSIALEIGITKQALSRGVAKLP